MSVLGLDSTIPPQKGGSRAATMAKAAGGVLGGGGLTIWLVSQLFSVAAAAKGAETKVVDHEHEIKQLQREVRVLRDHLVVLSARQGHVLGTFEPPAAAVEAAEEALTPEPSPEPAPAAK